MPSFAQEAMVFLSAFAVCTSVLLAEPQKSLSEADRNFILIETLNRLDGNVETNLALKEAVAKALPKVRGTAAFVQIVKKFSLKDQDESLLETAITNSNNEVGVEAGQLVLSHGHLELFKNALARPDEEAIKVIEVLGNVNEKQVVPLLVPVMLDSARQPAVRKMAVHSLARIQEGAEQLLKLVRENQLPETLKFAASSELNSAHWPQIKTAAAQLLPLPQGKNTQSLPPAVELVKMKGNIANGEQVFFRAESVCSKCHEVRGKGGQVGPNLSEIGTKLGREAIMEAILVPSAGISMGFEAYNITLQNGDEAYGLIASETADEVAVKDLNGIVARYKKSDVVKKEKLKTSIMPNGLQQTMTTQEFVDLIEYLSSLKKSP